MTVLRRASARSAVSLALAGLLLAGCSAAPAGSSALGAAQAEEAAAPVRLVDGWAKASAADGMTGVFGTLENHGDEDLVIVAVESDAAASAELHEVTSAGVMQEIPGEVVVPAGGSLEFAPGADHIMLMDLAHDLLAGDEVPLTLRFDDGTELDLSVLVKDYSGANESYGEQEHAGHASEDHPASGAGSGSGSDSDGHGGH